MVYLETRMSYFESNLNYDVLDGPPDKQFDKIKENKQSVCIGSFSNPKQATRHYLGYSSTKLILIMYQTISTFWSLKCFHEAHLTQHINIPGKTKLKLKIYFHSNSSIRSMGRGIYSYQIWSDWMTGSQFTLGTKQNLNHLRGCVR